MSSLFEKRKYIDDLNYEYGEGFFEGFLIKELIEAFDDIENSIPELTRPVTDLDSLHDYLWCCMFKKVAGKLEILNIPDEQKERFTKINELLILNKKSFINYINKHYIEVYNLNDTENLLLKNAVFETALSQLTDCWSDDLIAFLEEKFNLNILASFEKYEPYFKNKPEEIRKLFHNFENFKLFDDSIFVSFLIKFKNTALLKDYADKILTRAIAFFTSEKINGDSPEIIQFQSFFEDYYRLSKIYKSSLTNDYEIALENIKKALDYFIRNHGIKKTFGRVNLKEVFIDPLLADSDNLKFLKLSNDLKNNKVTCVLDNVLNIANPNPLSEAFEDISRGRSEIFPYHIQDEIILNLNFYSSGLVAIFNNDVLLEQFASYITTVCEFIEKEYFDYKIKIENEASSIVDAINYYIRLSKEKSENSYLGKYILRNVSITSILLIEKILRNVAFNESKNEMYFDIEHETLSTLLFGHKLDAIPESLKRHIIFYLLEDQTVDKINFRRPGLKLRNKLIHNYNEMFDKNNFACGMHCFYLLLAVINSLLATLLIEKK